jgi:hypothetical protein
MSVTNTTALGVVGAAVVHGPNSASAPRVRVQSIKRSIIKTKIDLDGILHLPDHPVMAHEPIRRREAI